MIQANRLRPRVKAAAVVALVFLAGGGAGIVGDRLMTPGFTVRTRLSGDMSGVLDKLGLTPEQRAQASAIIGRSTPRAEEAMREIAERLSAVADSLDGELRAILTVEQRARLDSMHRQKPTFMLKRKIGDKTSVDTVMPLPTRRP